MKRFLSIVALAALSMVPGISAVHAQAPATRVSTTPNAAAAGANVDVDRIIRAFTAKETQFRQALNQYGFKRDAVIQTIGQGGQISGEYHRTSSFIFDDKGNRYEKIVFFPLSTLTEIEVTNEDIEDLGGVQPFALEASKIDQYNFTYVGKEKIDELNLFVFDVAPKVTPDPNKVKERFFQGRIWVDDQDLQIVKVRGKGIPEGKQRFPIFETYREQVDGKYWFPTYTYVDDELVFPQGNVVHIRSRVRYTDFQRFRGSVRVLEDDGSPIQETPESQQKTPEKPKP